MISRETLEEIYPFEDSERESFPPPDVMVFGKPFWRDETFSSWLEFEPDEVAPYED